MTEFIQWVVLLLGVASVGMAIYFWRFFSGVQKRRGLARTMQAFLAEQLITSLGTLTFALSSTWAMLTGRPWELWNSIPPPVAQCIRLAMFGAMLHSTVRLSLEVRRIIREEE